MLALQALRPGARYLTRVQFGALVAVALIATVACSTEKDSNATQTSKDSAAASVSQAVSSAESANEVSKGQPAPSSGCTNSADSTSDLSQTPGTSQHHSLTSSDKERDFRLFVPSSSSESPAPLVLDFHGLGSNNDQEAIVSQYETVAGAQGAIVAAPMGLTNPNRWTPLNQPNNEDVVFIDDLIQHLESELCIDTNRIFSSGISNGGIISSILACQLGDKIAAVGLVSGIVANDASCKAKVPAMAFWGTADDVLPFAGGVGAALLGGHEELPTSFDYDALRNASGGGGFPPVLAAIREWSEHNSCEPQPQTQTLTDEVFTESYTKCNSPVVLYVVEGGGHTWPGSDVLVKADRKILGHTTDDIQATELMWEFFKSHPLDAR